MIVRTSQEDGIAFTVSLDGQVVYKLSELPESFILQFPASNSYRLTREPLDFLSNRRYILSDLQGVELAVIKANALHCLTSLSIGQDSYQVKSRTSSITEIFGHRRSLEVEGLGLHCEIIERFQSIHLTTNVEVADEVLSAAVVLLHVARIRTWRES